MLALWWTLTLHAVAHGALPTCLPRAAEQAPKDAVPSTIADAEVLARLVHAEATSTGFPDDPDVHRAIAWGVMNRVRLAGRSATATASYGSGVRGVAFRSGQFNPAVSPRSPFAAAMLCPTDERRWGLAVAAANEALAGRANPFIATPWSRPTTSASSSTSTTPTRSRRADRSRRGSRAPRSDSFRTSRPPP